MNWLKFQRYNIRRIDICVSRVNMIFDRISRIIFASIDVPKFFSNSLKKDILLIVMTQNRGIGKAYDHLTLCG